MSHFTKIAKATIISTQAFIDACAEFGLTSVLYNTKIKDFYGQEILVDVAIKAGKYHIALKKNEKGTYDMIADFWGIRTNCPEKLRDALHGELTDQSLADCILKYTTKHTIIQKYRRQGFNATVREDDEQNLIVELTN